jgi:methyltransferase-like protein
MGDTTETTATETTATETTATDSVLNARVDKVMRAAKQLSEIALSNHLTRQEVTVMFAMFIVSSLNNKNMINKIMERLQQHVDDLVLRGEKSGTLISDEEFKERVERMRRVKSENLF